MTGGENLKIWEPWHLGMVPSQTCFESGANEPCQSDAALTGKILGEVGRSRLAPNNVDHTVDYSDSKLILLIICDTCKIVDDAENGQLQRDSENRSEVRVLTTLKQWPCFETN